MRNIDTPGRRRFRLPVVAGVSGVLSGALLLTATPAGADTDSGTLLYAGQGANDCRAAGGVDFSDRGDRFTVHDYCPDGYRVVLQITQRRGDRSSLPAGRITNANGFDGAAETRTINIREGSSYTATLIVADGDDEIISESRSITE